MARSDHGAAGNASVVEPAAGGGGMTPSDLAELLGSFNEVTQRLESTHAQLRGEVVGLREQLRDANAQLERSRRLAAIGEMAAGISHEIRNPLGSIRLYASMLREDLQEMPEQLRMAERISEGIAGLDAIVSDVLSFARELCVRPQTVELDSFFLSCVESVHVPLMHAADRGRLVAVEWSVGAGAESAVLDSGLLRQAVVNLLRNAIEAIAGGSGSRVSLLASRVADASGDADADEAGWLRLCVEDDGPGVPESIRERMFNPFFTTRAAGTGLGLSIVQRIVDAHGGRIGVSASGPEGGSSASGGGSGTRFEIWLPPEVGAQDEHTLSIPAREHMNLRDVCR